MFKRTKVSAGVLLAIGSALALPSITAVAQDRVEITGSRIKRAAAEGSLPITVVSREQIEATGTVTVAEFIRTTTFASFGNFRPQSGSSAQGFSEANLRGLGSARTLVLVDGKRVAKDPQVGDAADMNSIPVAAIERIEILTDGASAIYGSDAIGGVINVILRKDFQGGVVTIGETGTSSKGGDRKEASALFGLSGERGRVLIGASASSRDIIFQRDSPLGSSRGASSYSNNYFQLPGLGGFLGAVPNGCNDPNFYTTNRCRYDFSFAAADEADVDNKSVFGRAEIRINNDWSAYLNASVSRTDTFGRYAPVPGEIPIEPGSPAYPVGMGATGTVYLAHRFAAGGNRDTFTDRNLYDTGIGVRGTVGGFDVDLGVRRTLSKFYEVGYGFVVQDLAIKAINEGRYNFRSPASNSADVINSFTTTTSRNGTWNQREIYANATTELFKMAGGNAAIFVGAENRTEAYLDIYDSLSEGGQVLGSSGASTRGTREVNSLAGELLLPLHKQLDLSIAARYEKYSDYGGDFSPKASLRFRAAPNVTLRASLGEGFRAPSLPQLKQNDAFSADSIVDRAHCLADGNTAAVCDANPSFQINGLVKSNPGLKSEKSKQYAFGGVWDVLPNLSLEATYWNTKIENRLQSFEAQDIVNRNNGNSPLPIPSNMSITRDASGFITSVVRSTTNEGELAVQGIDASAVFSHKYGSVGAFRHSLQYSHVMEWASNGTDQAGDFGQPKERVTVSNSWTRGPVSATWNINMIGKNGDDIVGHVGSYTTHDVQAKVALPIKGVSLTVGAMNLLKKLPQKVTDNTRQFNFDLYDAYGRQVYGRLEAKF
jgi:iron complex outermembrane receptor protein